MKVIGPRQGPTNLREMHTASEGVARKLKRYMRCSSSSRSFVAKVFSRTTAVDESSLMSVILQSC